MDPIFESYADNEETPGPRSGHVCCSLENSIFVWGGYNDVSQEPHLYGGMNGLHHSVFMNPSVVWFYYPDANKWFRLETTPPFPSASSGSASVYVPSKYSIYLFFGLSGMRSTNAVHSFDLVQLKWKRLIEHTSEDPNMPSPRDKFALWHHRNKIYVFGGYGPPLHGYLHNQGSFDEDESQLMGLSYISGWNNQLLEFDIDLETWREVPCTGSIPSSRAVPAATRVGDDVFLFGGRHLGNRLNDLYQLSLLDMNWTSIQPNGLIPCGRSWHTLVHPHGSNHFIVIGGYSNDWDVLGDMWAFDIETQTWSECSHTSNLKRLWHTAAVTNNNDIIVFGGCVTSIRNNPPTHTNELASLRFSPDYLLRLAMKIILKNRNVFQNHLDDLPEFCRSMLRKVWRMSDLTDVNTGA